MGCELLITYWPASSSPGHAMRMNLLTEGPYGPLLGAELVLGGIVPAAILFTRLREKVPLVLVASGLVVGGIFAKRAVLLVMGLGFSPLGVRADYWPTLAEVVVSAGVWSIGALVVTLAVALLDLEVKH